MSKYLHIDAFVISAQIDPTMVHQILVDNSSYVSLLYKNDFDAMRLLEKHLHPCMCTLQGFFGARKMPMGVTDLTIELGEASRTMIRQVKFVVLDGYSATKHF